MPNPYTILLGLLLGAAQAAAQPSTPSPTPEGARLVTEDLDRFWTVWDESGGAPDAAALQRGYLDPGSAGLAAFLRLRIESAEALARQIAAAPEYYASLRPIGPLIKQQQPAILAAMRKLEALYPDAVFPDVYFLIGRMNSAGTLDPGGLLIGIDMHGRREGVDLSGLHPWHQAVIARPDQLARIVAHELIHYQQSGRGDQPSLLQQSLAEGSADLLAERIAGGHINDRAHAFGRANECVLWQEFSARMHARDFSGFLYGGDDDSGRPADLGYFIGYRIAEAYLARAGWTQSGLGSLLRDVDASTVLERSGYAPCD